MKARSYLYLAATATALFLLPAACSNDSDTKGGDGDGDSLGGNGGVAGDGDIIIGDGDGDAGGSGDGDLSFPDPPDCDSIGSACDGDGTCCSGYCDEDSGECSCGPAGSDCLVGEDCCSGQCNPLTNQCVQVLGTCAQEGTPCGNGTECCTLSCIDGFCSGDACVPDNEPCSQDGECCAGTCGADGMCTPLNNGSSCNTAGNTCADGGDCCSGLCSEEGSCAIGSSYCIQVGDVCSSDTQCCQGLCNKADGASVGFCDERPSGGTNCGGDNRRTAGQICDDDCAQCCSRTCAPYGPSGVSICQPATGCRPDGELCRTAGDCCGGNPDSTLPGAGKAQCLKESPDDEVGRCKVTGCNPHGSICGDPDEQACTGSLSAPDGRSCCEKQGIDQPCVADSLLVPRCNVLEGCMNPTEECATADDCCNGNPCVQHSDGVFRCYDTTDECVPSGGPCTATADCCVGSLCILEPGQATGVCGNTDPPGGMGGNSGTGGSSSGSGGSTTTVCAEYGQDCESHDDCCNDIPCDPASNTCRFPVVR